MEMSEFLQPTVEEEEITPVETEEEASEELDVQKAVVEALAADKAAQDEHITSLRKTIVELRTKLAQAENQLALKSDELSRIGDVLSANTETTTSNQVSILDRSDELKDRFPGETRDHILEVIKEARDNAEKNGRSRLAQILEGVLLTNTPVGILAERRAEINKLFAANQNILSGAVIEQLKKWGISHKKGEEYLLPKEIINNNY